MPGWVLKCGAVVLASMLFNDTAGYARSRSLLRSAVLCLNGLRFLPVWCDIVCADRDMILVDDFKNGLPTPRWGVRGDIVFPFHYKSPLNGFAAPPRQPPKNDPIILNLPASFLPPIMYAILCGLCPRSMMHREAVMWVVVHASDGDDDFPSGVSLFDIPDGLGDFAQQIRPVDHRRDFAGLDELLQEL